MRSSSTLALLSIASILFLSGCGKNHKYQPRRLTPLNHSNAHSSRTKDGVTVSVKSLDEEEQTYYFGKETSNIHPVHIAIDNQSDTTWILDKNNISLPLADAKTIEKTYKEMPWTSVGLGVACLFTPLYAGVILAPVAITHGILSYNANKVIEADIAEKNIEKTKFITPEAYRNAVLFSDSVNELQRFTVSLVDADDPSHTLHFTLSA